LQDKYEILSKLCKVYYIINSNNNLENVKVLFKDINYFKNLNEEISNLLLLEKIDNESDDKHENFIMNTSNNALVKNLVIKSQYKSSILSKFKIIKNEEVNLWIK